MAAGLTQEGLADRSGLDRSYIGGVERGERNPTLSIIEKIADGLGVSLVELFSYSAKK
jgi:transcriptional regulator with XRE-family HTH domain